MVQAFRDFCSSPKGAVGVAMWLRTDNFDIACIGASIDCSKTLSVFEALSRYDFPLRTQIMRETITAVLGGGANAKEKPEGD